MAGLDRGRGTGDDGFRRFADMLGRRVELDLSDAGPDSLLRDDLGVDSLIMAEVVIVLADLGVVLPDELLGELRTLGDLHHYARVLAPSGPAGGAAEVLTMRAVR